MTGIEINTFAKIPDHEKSAMRANYAETFGVPVDRVGWRGKKRRGVERMFLYLKPKPRRITTPSPAETTMNERLKPLLDWLERNHARCLWVLEDENRETRFALRVEGHVVNGVLIHVALMGRDKKEGWGTDGWSIYVPASHKNNVAAELDAAARACGLSHSEADIQAALDFGRTAEQHLR